MTEETLRFTDYLDPTFQELVLGLALHDEDFLARARPIIKPEYFAGVVYREITRALFKYWDTYRQLPEIGIAGVAVSKLAADSTTRDAYVQTVRRIYDLSEDDLDKHFIEDELVTFAQRAEAAVAVGTAWRALKTFDITQLAAELARIQKLPAVFADLGLDLQANWRTVFAEDLQPRFSTGYHDFDRAMRGGPRPGELVVLLAPLKRGKSLILTNLGASLFIMGYHVIHYSLEMYREDVMRRYLGCLTRCPVNSITNYVDILSKTLSSYASITPGSITIKDFQAREATVAILEGHTNLVTAGKDKDVPTVVILDYADLVRGEKQQEEWKEMDEVYVGLRNWGKRGGHAVITASQTNVAGFNAEKIDATHQSKSTRKGFVADYMWAVQQSDMDYKLNRFQMVPFLNRNERKDMVTYWRAKYDCSVIDEISKEEYAALSPMEEEGEQPKKVRRII